MDVDHSGSGNDERSPAGLHPLAAAVALTLAGAFSGCATHTPPPGASEMDRARSAYARQDYAEAARLLSEPAMKGDAAAQYALGYLYYYGQGVPRDGYRARSWLESSAHQGHRDARRALSTLSVYGKLPNPPRSVAVTAPSAAPTAAPTSPAPGAAEMPAMAPATAEPAVGAAPARATEVAPAAPLSNPETPPSDATTAGNGATVPPAAEPVPARVVQCAPAEAAPAKTPPGGVGDNAASRVPAEPVPAPEERMIHEEPDAAMVVRGDEAEGARPVAVALHRPATTLVRHREEAAPASRPRYTIHLLSSPRREELRQTVEAFGLTPTAWYAVQQGNGVQYRLIYGGFETMAEARAALRRLPEPLYASHPWVNNYPTSVTITAFNGVPTARVAAVGRTILR